MIGPGGRVTLFGWDASDFDWSRGPMDLGAAKADGITWFTHKATESTNVRHVHLADALTRARSAGFEFLGAYHVVRSSPSVDAQVNYFLGTLDQQVPWWRDFPGFMLQVDLELWSYDQVSAATGVAFANQLVAAQPKRVLTYASRGMYGNSLGGLATPLWNAAYGTDPAVPYRQGYPGDNGVGWLPYSGQTPLMWQYGSRLIIGTQPGCDANAFRGSLEELRYLITGRNVEEEPMLEIPRDSAGALWVSTDRIMRRRLVTDNDVRYYLNRGATVPYQPNIAANGAPCVENILEFGVDIDPIDDPRTALVLTEAQLEQIRQSARAGAESGVQGPDITEIRTVVDEELDEQSRGGADND